LATLQDPARFIGQMKPWRQARPYWDFAAELLLKTAETREEDDIEAATAQMERALGVEGLVVMPREGAITFRDLVGKLTVLRIEGEKCGRSGRYRLDRLIMRYGIDAKLFDWSGEITVDCPPRPYRTCARANRAFIMSAGSGCFGPMSRRRRLL